ncbi:MAG TPA: heme ABC transporter permease [Gammaproteobacteria bacterium]|nr:heme ABC transporter permease [Gammaproteobacteria bacterium]
MKCLPHRSENIDAASSVAHVVSSRRWSFGIGLFVLLVVVAVAALGVGAVSISPGEIISILVDSLGFPLAGPLDSAYQQIITSIRFPRVALAVLVGAGLAISGAAMQGLFRNPLADPALIGISSGAALAAVAVIVLGATLLSGYTAFWGIYALPVAAFLGGLVTTFLVYQFSNFNGRTSVSTMLLAGIAINALTIAVTGLLTYMANDEQLRTLTFWSMGSLGGASWDELRVAAPILLLSIVLIPLQASALNALLLGESEALHLGYNLERVKRGLIVLVALCVGVSVSFTGIIGFIGLITPHLLRLSIGPDHRFLLPFSALLGASLLLASDLLARTLVSPAELPIGIITSLVGGPFFLWLLLRQRRRGESW